jgi:uncharacterized protein YbjT (DUF2867 family)
MTTETVAVFSASGRPGLAQIRQLKARGYAVRAVSRHRLPAFEGLEVVAADLNDPASVSRACEGVDAVFFTSPTFTERDRGVEHAATLGEAARAAGVRRLVFNTTSWHPDRLIGVPSMDHCYLRTKALQDSGVPLTVVRPSLFMDNLLTNWVKPEMLRTGEFAYPHAEELEVSWICLDDVGMVMTETLADEAWEGQIIDIGGPETLRPGEVAEQLSAALGRPIVYRRITPREFGERMYEVFKDVCGQSREAYVSQMEKHYLFKNKANPFRVPLEGMPKSLSANLTHMSDWLARQDWSLREAGVGSVSG